MNKILLVNPWIHDFSAYDLWMKPLGLLYIASYLEQAGYQVSLIDCLDRNHPSVQKLPPHTRSRLKEFGCGELPRQFIPKPALFQDIPRKYKRYGITPEAFRSSLLELSKSQTPALIVVTSIMTYWYPGVFEAIRYLKETFPRVPVVLGGLYATLCYDHAQRLSGADYVIKGPGEQAVLRLADQITGETRDYETSPDDLVHLPYPAYHLYPKLDYIAVLTSKGCPFRCNYCATPLLTPALVQRPPENVINEIKYCLDRFKIKDIAFYDDALLVNAERHFEPILDRIINEGINHQLRFHTPNGLHIRFITPSLARKMYQAGCRTLRLSFDVGPKVQLPELGQTLNYLKEAGFTNEDIRCYVLMGLPGQSLDEVVQMIEGINRLGARISLVQYAPIPGTPDFDSWLRLARHDGDEPLAHNKSVYPARSADRSFRDYEKIKVMTKRLNHQIIGL